MPATVYACLHIFLVVSVGDNINRVLKIYIPGYAERGFLGRMSTGLPVAIAYIVLMRFLAEAIISLSGDVQGSTLLALLAGLSALLWLRDRCPERDY